MHGPEKRRAECEIGCGAPKTGPHAGSTRVRRSSPKNINAHAIWIAMLVARYAAGSVSLAAKLRAKVKPATGRPASGVYAAATMRR